jgi:hypothetical protein
MTGGAALANFCFMMMGRSVVCTTPQDQGEVRVRHDRFFGEHTHDYCKIVPALQYAPYCLAGLVDLQGRGGSKARVRHDMIRTKDMTRRISRARVENIGILPSKKSSYKENAIEVNAHLSSYNRTSLINHPN